jgi:hypothetical protein
MFMDPTIFGTTPGPILAALLVFGGGFATCFSHFHPPVFMIHYFISDCSQLILINVKKFFPIYIAFKPLNQIGALIIFKRVIIFC